MTFMPDFVVLSRSNVENGPPDSGRLFSGPLTHPRPIRISGAPSHDKGTPGESQGRKATGPRLLRDARLISPDATKDPKTAKLPMGTRSFVLPYSRTEVYMLRSAFIPALPLVSILVLACDGEPGSDLTNPSHDLRFKRLQQATGAQQQVTGSIFINLTEFGGAPQRMAFSAIRHHDGQATGQFQIFSAQEPGIRVHGIVTCLGIDGSLARIGGVITKSSPTGFESPAFWAVVDNGEGSGSPADQSTDVAAFAPPEIVEEFCAVGFEVPFLPSLQGNIQVHP